MHKFIALILLAFAASFLATSGYSKTQEEAWLLTFIDLLEPTSEPAVLITRIQQPASAQDQIEALAAYNKALIEANVEEHK